MNANGSGKSRLTNTNNANEFDAKFSPDGLFFVFTRTRNETDSELMRMRTNGTGLRKLTDTPNKFEVDADWQPIVKSGE
jgi:Tol biopolymer transport system component